MKKVTFYSDSSFIVVDCKLQLQDGSFWDALEYDGGAYLENDDCELYKCEIGEKFNFIDMPMFVNEHNQWEEI